MAGWLFIVMTVFTGNLSSRRRFSNPSVIAGQAPQHMFLLFYCLDKKNTSLFLEFFDYAVVKDSISLYLQINRRRYPSPDGGIMT